VRRLRGKNSMAITSSKHTMDAAASVIRSLGIAGPACVLWTVIACTYLYTDHSSFPLFEWHRIYWTWIAIVSVNVAATLLIAVRGALSKESTRPHLETDDEPDL
jgi:hypothetical protein